jgi:lipid-binding SYLF domain-containing protein
MRNRAFAIAGMLAVACLAAAAPAQAADKAELLRDANMTVNHLRSDPAFATAERMLRDAKAVYIVPHLVKGGFVFGAEGGSGVVLRRVGRTWGEPKFYDMGSASFGFQAGLEKAELVFIINSDRALAGIEHGNFKLGGQAGVTVATLSSGAEGATTAHGGDMVVWSSGTGLFGGVAFNGSVITPDKDLNSTPTMGPEATALRANLGRIR